MATSTLQLGRMTMREDLTTAEQGDSEGARTMTLSGQESIPRLSAAAVALQREDFLTMAGQFVPVVFSRKTYLNGFYTIEDVQGTIEDWGDGLATFKWSANLTRAGTESEVDIESRLSGATTRVNNFAVVGERTHAPAITHGAYWTNATVTAAVSRTGEDGVLKLYRGVGATTNPRWVTTPAGYATGRVRFTDSAGFERAGDGAKLAATGWTLSNGLVRVRPLASGGALEVSAYTGGAWHAKEWDVLIDAVSVGSFDYCTLISNQYEAVSLRLMKMLTIGRFYLDVTLRRGHRFTELYLQDEYSATLKVVRATADIGVNTLAGTIVDTANDADGNKYIIGSAKTFTADTANGGISKAATTTLDAFIGVVAAGTGAVTGDAAADLQKQYIGMPNEMVQGVLR
jgi:hypothetical protein